MRFNFEDRVDECNKGHQIIMFYSFPEHEMQEIFALKYTIPVTNFEEEYIGNGWGVWDPEREFDVDQGINFKSPTCVSFLIFLKCYFRLSEDLRIGTTQSVQHIRSSQSSHKQ